MPKLPIHVHDNPALCSLKQRVRFSAPTRIPNGFLPVPAHTVASMVVSRVYSVMSMSNSIRPKISTIRASESHSGRTWRGPPSQTRLVTPTTLPQYPAPSPKLFRRPHFSGNDQFKPPPFETLPTWQQASCPTIFSR